MPHSFKNIFCIIAVSLCLFMPRETFAGESIKSKYFNAHIDKAIDRVAILRKLDAGYFLRMNAAYFDQGKASADADDMIANTLDAIYMESSDILDIHVYDLVINLEIAPDRGALSGVLESALGKKLSSPSFYSYDSNTIYISFRDMNAGMLAHEITHAIVSRYFAVPPSVKVQEVLCGYAEYSIKKLLGKARIKPSLNL